MLRLGGSDSVSHVQLQGSTALLTGATGGIGQSSSWASGGKRSAGSPTAIHPIGTVAPARRLLFT